MLEFLKKLKNGFSGVKFLPPFRDLRDKYTNKAYCIYIGTKFVHFSFVLEKKIEFSYPLFQETLRPQRVELDYIKNLNLRDDSINKFYRHIESMKGLPYTVYRWRHWLPINCYPFQITCNGTNVHLTN